MMPPVPRKIPFSRIATKTTTVAMTNPFDHGSDTWTATSETVGARGAGRSPASPPGAGRDGDRRRRRRPRRRSRPSSWPPRSRRIRRLRRAPRRRRRGFVVRSSRFGRLDRLGRLQARARSGSGSGSSRLGQPRARAPARAPASPPARAAASGSTDRLRLGQLALVRRPLRRPLGSISHPVVSLLARPSILRSARGRQCTQGSAHRPMPRSDVLSVYASRIAGTNQPASPVTSVTSPKKAMTDVAGTAMIIRLPTPIATRHRPEDEREPEADHPAQQRGRRPLLEQRLARDEEDHVRDAGPEGEPDRDPDVVRDGQQERQQPERGVPGDDHPALRRPGPDEADDEAADQVARADPGLQEPPDRRSSRADDRGRPRSSRSP